MNLKARVANLETSSGYGVPFNGMTDTEIEERIAALKDLHAGKPVSGELLAKIGAEADAGRYGVLI